MEVVTEYVGKFLNWVLIGLITYSVAATLFIRTMTVDVSTVSNAQTFLKEEVADVSKRQTRVEVDVVRAVEGFRSDIVELKTEVKLLRRQIHKEVIAD